MRVSRFYIGQDLVLSQPLEPEQTLLHYMRNVLRLNKGAEVMLFNGQNDQDFRALVDIQRKTMTLTPFEIIEKRTESPLDIHLLLAVGKPDRIDLALQKATELGVQQFTIFNAERSQTPIRANRLQKKLAHLQAVIISACEQSGRNRIPALDFQADFSAMLSHCSDGQRLMLDFAGQSLQNFQTQDSSKRFLCLIGPEGGLSNDEILQAESAGFDRLYLGPRVLRMETAAITVASLLQQRYGDI